MNAEYIRDYCLSKKEVEESFPFGEETLVFKKKGKIFLLMNLDTTPLKINVKCNPDKAIELREQYTFVQPGYHMNKKHWNTITMSEIPALELLKEWIDHSYDLVK
ncbi:MAG: MmcQ/YjbR family DNA-binding protein [Niabella sp.]